MSEIEKAFEAGYRAYRDAFDHYDDFEETVEHSLKWRMVQYVAAQQSVQRTCFYCEENKEPAKEIICQDCVDLLSDASR